MKFILQILFALSMFSCSIQNCKIDFKEIVIDEVGIIEICLPQEFDMEFKTVSITDYGCKFISKGFICSEKHNFPIIDTIFNFYVHDSVINPLKIHSLGITFYENRKCDDNPDINEERLEDAEKFQMENNVKTEVLIKRLEKINGLEFLIFGYRTMNDSSCFETMDAETKIDSTEITLLFQKVSSDSTSFVDDMYKVLKTIRKK